MFDWIRRALRGDERSPIELVRDFTFVWAEPRPFLFWTRMVRVRSTFTVRALPIGERIATQLLITRLVDRYGEKITDGVICAAITGNAQAGRLPPEALTQIWDAYAELNHIPKAQGGAETTASPSSTSPSDSSGLPSTSPGSGSSP